MSVDQPLSTSDNRITKLRVLLTTSSIPQFRIAGLSGVHPSRLSEYSLGKRPIQPKHLIALSEFFQLPADQIVGYETDPDLTHTLPYTQESRPA